MIKINFKNNIRDYTFKEFNFILMEKNILFKRSSPEQKGCLTLLLIFLLQHCIDQFGCTTSLVAIYMVI